MKRIFSKISNFYRSNQKFELLIQMLMSLPLLPQLVNLQKNLVCLISPSYRISQRIALLLEQHILETERLADKLEPYSLVRNEPAQLSNRQSAENKLEQKIRAMALHQKTFSKYKNMHQGKEVVLIATGPSLQHFKPIAGAVYIGVNTAFQYDMVKFNYYFTQDYTGMKQYMNELGTYIGNNTKRFYGIPDESVFDLPIQIPESIAIAHGAERYYCKDCREYSDYAHNMGSCEKLFPFTFPHDISLAPLADYRSVVFPALQFALYTNPKKLYLVGCDCNNAGHFNKRQPSRLYVDVVKNGYHQLKIFAAHHYPGTEIISINPVGLKGFFTDSYTE